MVSQTFTVTNSVGLHLRPAGVFSTAMNQFECSTTIIFKGNRIDAKSVLNIMMAGIVCGSEIVLECDGPDEQAAMQKAADLINGGLEIL
ncbi:MAG: HPr family phosphocarrier protein [Acutalibacteraceae bacterium]|nr:HPr family phosphocarrier protein [Clostridia bacterium]MEE3403394.1 HPr family phosphocarrier protein [Acutalibacteraceae bacterium]HCA54875.1 HPr family phosphocarrier protein [Oscillospiraceae bacterium]